MIKLKVAMVLFGTALVFMSGAIIMINPMLGSGGIGALCLGALVNVGAVLYGDQIRVCAYFIKSDNVTAIQFLDISNCYNWIVAIRTTPLSSW